MEMEKECGKVFGFTCRSKDKPSHKSTLAFVNKILSRWSIYRLLSPTGKDQTRQFHDGKRVITGDNLVTPRYDLIDTMVISFEEGISAWVLSEVKRQEKIKESKVNSDVHRKRNQDREIHNVLNDVPYAFVDDSSTI